jgi:hypothetical protein
MRELIQKFDRKFFFPFMKKKEYEKFYVKEATVRFVYREDTLQHTPQLLKEYLASCTKNWDLHGFHFHYNKPCTIEPTLGWGISKDFKLIPQSLWHTYVHLHKPSFFKYLLSPRKKLFLTNAIPLHYGWGSYWHFYNDIIGAIRLADEAGLPLDTPILIAEGLSKTRFFQDVLALSPSLQKRNWVLQNSQTNAYCSEAHFFTPLWNHRENFDAVLKYIGFYENLQQETAGNKRIFIGRNQSRGRTILNLDELKEVLIKYDFIYTDCDDLNLLQQIEVFQHAAYVIGVHGAGLTNIVYRQGRPMKLLEIFSAKFWNPCYYLLCVQYQYDYFGLVGSEPSEDGMGNFSIDIQEFENQILLMVR